MDDSLENNEEKYDLVPLEQEIYKLLASNMESTYNKIDSWALVVRAHSNDGEGDRHYGGMFMPPDLDMFNAQGLRWLFDEGLHGRYGSH